MEWVPSDDYSYVPMKKPPLEITPSPEELVVTFFKWADPSDSNRDFAVLPYINGSTEPLARLLRETAEFELQVDLSRPYNRNFFPQVKTAGRSTSKCRLIDYLSMKLYRRNGKVFKNRKEHTRNTKSYKKIPTLPLTHG